MQSDYPRSFYPYLSASKFRFWCFGSSCIVVIHHDGVVSAVAIAIVVVIAHDDVLVVIVLVVFEDKPPTCIPRNTNLIFLLPPTVAEKWISPALQYAHHLIHFKREVHAS